MNRKAEESFLGMEPQAIIIWVLVAFILFIIVVGLILKKHLITPWG